ncbi:MAG TPA: DUF167 domain-containing protein [Candidatus Binatia bacterium]|nr:DUF167 domain-containing protein [Candidatus Binatia bacterium]
MNPVWPPWLTMRDGSIELRVQVLPRSSRQGVAGVVGDRLKILLHSAPVDGEANRSLIDVLAEVCEVARGRIRIVSGESSRAKKVVITTEDPQAEARRLMDALPRPR